MQLWLDSKKQVTRHEVQGGSWLTAEEYAAEVDRQAQEAEAAASDAASPTESTFPEAGSHREDKP